MTPPSPDPEQDAKGPARGGARYTATRLVTEAPWYVWLLFGALLATMILTLIMILEFRFGA